MEYVVMDIDSFAVDTLEQISAVQAEMSNRRYYELDVWVCPQASLEDAEAVGFEGAYKNGRKVFV
jgi:hypothetical protein